MKSVFFIVSFLFNLLNADIRNQSIFVLHSYSQEYKWTKLQHDAFVSTVTSQTGAHVDFSVEYLDTKGLNTHQSMDSFLFVIFRKNTLDTLPMPYMSVMIML